MTHWPVLSLRDLGTWYGGGTPSKSRPEFWTAGTVPWLSPKDMTSETLSRVQDHITEHAVAGSAVRKVPVGSVALVVRSGILQRRIPIALVPFETTLNQDIKAIVPHPDVDPRWIAWALRAKERELLHACRKAGTTVASLDTARLQRIKVPVPPLDEQLKTLGLLEDHLSRLEAADSTLNDAQQRLVALKQRSLDELLDGPGSRLVELGSLIQRVEAGRSFGGSAPPAIGDQWGVIKVSAMTWGEFRPQENKAVPSDRADPRYEISVGDVLVSRANTTAYVGAPVLVRDTPRRRLLSDKSLRLVPRADVNREWLVTVLSAPGTRRQISAMATGTKDSMRNISQQNLLRVQVPWMATAEQEHVVLRHSSIQNSVARLSAELEVARNRSGALRRAILNAAFSGRLTGRATDLDRVGELVGAAL